MIKKRYLIIMVALLLVGILSTTYAYFYVTVTGSASGSSVITTGTLSVAVSDGILDVTDLAPVYDSNYESSYVKTFLITNTSTKLDGELSLFINVTAISNNLISRNLKYKLVSEDVEVDGNFENVTLNNNYLLVTDISLPKTQSKSFDLYIWLSYSNDENQIDMLGGSMSAKIYALLGDDPTEGKWYDICNSNRSELKCKMLSTNTPTADTSIDFSQVSSSTNGQGLYYTTDTTKTFNSSRVYYYRGNVSNNYVVYAGYCWKILRTNEHGEGIKLFYWGPSTNNTCSTTAASNGIGQSTYNAYSNSNKYLGYMYGNTCDTYNNCTKNTLNSSLKTSIDSWYYDNIITNSSSVLSLLNNVPYCNDRTIGTAGQVASVTYGEIANGTNNVIYGATRRLATGGDFGTSFNSTNASPTFKCSMSDSFTLKENVGGLNGYGTSTLDYPIATITADELVYAGAAYGTNNTSFFLKTGSSYYTMTPSTYTSNAYVFYLDNNGNLSRQLSSYNYGVYPVITISAGSIARLGDGNAATPFVVY